MSELARIETVGAVAGQELDAIKEQVRLVSNTELVPGHYRGKPYACLAAVLYGREIGLAPMESLQELYIVDGRPTLSAKAMCKRARQMGHSITGETSSDEAIVRGRRGDNGDEMTVRFTLEDARKQGLLQKKNWQKSPDDMLWARAVSRLCRRLFPDVLAAASHTREELEPTITESIGSVLERPPADRTVRVEADPFEGAPADEPTEAAAAADEGDAPVVEEIEEAVLEEQGSFFEQKAADALKRKAEKDATDA